MTNLSFARVSLRPDAAVLLDAAVDATDPRYEDHVMVMGTDFFAEAFASSAARDAALGPVDPYVEFVPASEREIEAMEYPVNRMAIGPALGDPGFEAVADVVLPAAVAAAQDRGGDVTVVVARVSYSVRAPMGDQSGQVTIYPLFGNQTTPADQNTARWLLDCVATRFTERAT